MRTLSRLVATLVASVALLFVVGPLAASAATAIEYGLLN